MSEESRLSRAGPIGPAKQSNSSNRKPLAVKKVVRHVLSREPTLRAGVSFAAASRQISERGHDIDRTAGAQVFNQRVDAKIIDPPRQAQLLWGQYHPKPSRDAVPGAPLGVVGMGAAETRGSLQTANPSSTASPPSERTVPQHVSADGEKHGPRRRSPNESLQRPISADPDQLINESELSALLNLATATLRNWRVKGQGPRWIRLSPRAVRYRFGDVRQWLADRQRRSTSEGEANV